MIYSISNKKLYVEIETEGAQLKSIKSQNSKIEYLWQGDPDVWRGRAYNLFPFVGRRTDGKYTVHGKEYEMPMHGFARNMEFVVSYYTQTMIKFTICATDETYKWYPFKFIFEVTYSLEGNCLSYYYNVMNIDEKKMYFGLGGHPGINVPFNGG